MNMKAELNEQKARETKYMNIATGSVDTHDGWWYEDEDGVEVNAVDRGEVIELESARCSIAIKSIGKLAASTSSSGSPKE